MRLASAWVAAAWAAAACAAAAWEAARAAAVCAALGAVVGVAAFPVSELPFADVLFVMTLFEAVLAGLLAGANGLDETAVGASLPSPPPPHPASRSRTAALIWILWFVVDIFNPVCPSCGRQILINGPFSVKQEASLAVNPHHSSGLCREETFINVRFLRVLLGRNWLVSWGPTAVGKVSSISP